MQQNILYIHGFNSSPLSLKAEQTRKYFEKHFPTIHFYCPQLASSPGDAMAQLIQIVEQKGKNNQWYFIGSSLGGYFASYLSDKYNALTVLVNPAIRPYELLEDYLGEQTNPYTHIVYQVTTSHIQELKNLERPTPSIDCPQKNNYLVMVQTADEVLNYQHAVEKYQHCQLIVQKGGDHSFVGFDNTLPSIIDFFQLA
jgi:predicted esterase YcpF (UPF0227 family)